MAKPGNKRSLVGQVTVKAATEGFDELTKKLKKIENLVQKIFNPDGSKKDKDKEKDKLEKTQLRMVKFNQSIEELNKGRALSRSEESDALKKLIIQYHKLEQAQVQNLDPKILKTMEDKLNQNKKYERSVAFIGDALDLLGMKGSKVGRIIMGATEKFEQFRKIKSYFSKLPKLDMVGAASEGMVKGAVAKAGVGEGASVIAGAGATANAVSKSSSAMSQFGEALSMVNTGIGTLAKGIMIGGVLLLALAAFTAAVFVVTTALTGLMVGLNQVINAQDKFRTAQYRSIGSLRDTIDAHRDLAFILLKSTEEIVKTTDAMIESGLTSKSLQNGVVNLSGVVVYGIEAFKAVAVEIDKMSEVTGVAQSTVAGLYKTFQTLTGDISGATEVVGDMLNVMNEMGLSSAGMNSVMGALTANISKFRVGSNVSKESLRKYAHELTVLTATAEASGIALDAVNRIMSNVNDITEEGFTRAAMAGQLQQYLSGDINARLDSQINGLEAMYKRTAGMSAGMRQYALKTMGATLEEIDLVTQLNSMGSKERAKMLSDRKAQIMATEQYNKALGTISRALQAITIPFKELLSKYAEPIAEGITRMFDVIRQYAPTMFNELKLLLESLFGKFDPNNNSMLETFEAVGHVISENIIKAIMWLREDLPYHIETVAIFIDEVSAMFTSIKEEVNSIFNIWDKVSTLVEWVSNAISIVTGTAFVSDGIGMAADTIKGMFEGKGIWESFTDAGQKALDDFTDRFNPFADKDKDKDTKGFFQTMLERTKKYVKDRQDVFDKNPLKPDKEKSKSGISPEEERFLKQYSMNNFRQVGYDLLDSKELRKYYGVDENASSMPSVSGIIGTIGNKTYTDWGSVEAQTAAQKALTDEVNSVKFTKDIDTDRAAMLAEKFDNLIEVANKILSRENPESKEIVENLKEQVKHLREIKDAAKEVDPRPRSDWGGGKNPASLASG